MEALHGRVSYASWRLRVFRQLFLPSSSPIRPQRLISTTHNNTNSSHHQDEPQEPVHTPPSQLLPQSPLITNPHPERAVLHRKKRPPTPSDLSDLSKNPWAMALASPVRLCTLTGARAPKALLTDWGLVEAAVPSNLDSDVLPESAAKKKEEEKKLWLLPIGLLEDELLLHSPQKSQQNGRKKPPSFLKMRMVDRLPTLENITETMSRVRGSKRSPVARLLPFRSKAPSGPITKHEEARLAWRKDMPKFVLAMMRRQALTGLKRVSDRFKRQDVANRVWSSIQVDVCGRENGGEEQALTRGLEKMEPFERMGSGAVLVLGEEVSTNLSKPGGDGELELREGRGDGSQSLPELVTLPLLKTKVPVFDLRWMFSREDLQDIRSHHERFRRFSIFLRPTDQLTVDAVLTLWKLRGLMRAD